MISFDEAKELLDYNPETGVITWKVQRGSRKAGTKAGTINGMGYQQIFVNYKTYLAHRLAWLLHSKEWPPEEIDHINGDRSDNRYMNLRLVNKQENHRNERKNRRNKSGVMGVNSQPGPNPWYVQIRCNGRNKHVGVFADWFDAVCARKAAEHKHGFHINHGNR